MSKPVGMRRPNAFQIYDMIGNVWEWCEDVFHLNYDGAPADGSAWLTNDELGQKVKRGGSFTTRNFDFLRCAARASGSSMTRDCRDGFSSRWRLRGLNSPPFALSANTIRIDTMTTATQHFYIVSDDQILGGEPIIKGTRTPVRAIVEMWRLGVAPEEIPTHLPHLTLAQSSTR
jgi:uncharacterized protein (DUF433 family)